MTIVFALWSYPSTGISVSADKEDLQRMAEWYKIIVHKGIESYWHPGGGLKLAPSHKNRILGKGSMIISEGTLLD